MQIREPEVDLYSSSAFVYTRKRHAAKYFLNENRCRIYEKFGYIGSNFVDMVAACYFMLCRFKF